MSAIFRYHGNIVPLKEMPLTEFKELLTKILRYSETLWYEIEWYTPIIIEGYDEEYQDFRLGFSNNVIFGDEWFILNITGVFKRGYEEYMELYEEKLRAMFDKYFKDGIIEIRNPVIGVQE